MTTVINTPGTGDSSTGATNVILGIIVLVIVAAVFIVFVLPRMQSSETPKDSKVDVNVILPSSDNK